MAIFEVKIRAEGSPRVIEEDIEIALELPTYVDIEDQEDGTFSVETREPVDTDAFRRRLEGATGCVATVIALEA